MIERIDRSWMSAAARQTCTTPIAACTGGGPAHRRLLPVQPERRAPRGGGDLPLCRRAGALGRGHRVDPSAAAVASGAARHRRDGSTWSATPASSSCSIPRTVRRVRRRARRYGCSVTTSTSWFVSKAPAAMWSSKGWRTPGGRKHVSVAGGAGPAGFRGAREVEAPPAPLTIGGAWRLTLIPTLDNRWGDFRLPATDRLIGPEARRFRYREEQDTAGTDLDWHAAGFDDSYWQDYLYSEGPFAFSLGPFRPGSEPAEIENGAVRLDAGHVVDGRTHRWQPFAFSLALRPPALHARRSRPPQLRGRPGGVHRLPAERGGRGRRRPPRALPAGQSRRAPRRASGTCSSAASTARPSACGWAARRWPGCRPRPANGEERP